MRHFNTLTLLSAAAIAAIAIPALAAGPTADLDQDGQVTQAEFSAEALAKFKAADINFDGSLDETEHEALRENFRDEMISRKFSELDINDDGSLTEAELKAGEYSRRERFGDKDQGRDERGRGDRKSREDHRADMKAQIDTNGDGVVSEEEKQTMYEMFKAKRGEGKERHHWGKRDKRIELDANDDGLISQAEFVAHADQLFLRMDANGDGVLVQGEGQKREGPPRR